MAIIPFRENPNHYDAEEPMVPEPPFVAANMGASNVPALPMTQREERAERARLRQIEGRRIRPGFYTGIEPHDEGRPT